MEKTFISANKLYEDSFKLAKKIWDSGFRPNIIIGIWRGGVPLGFIIHEFLKFKYKEAGLPEPYLTSIKTSSYNGLKSTGTVSINGMEQINDLIKSTDKLLLVDDIFETGFTMKRVADQIKAEDIRTATIYYKSKKNKTSKEPDYYQEINNDWVVFPQELAELTKEEIKKKSQLVYDLITDTS